MFFHRLSSYVPGNTKLVHHTELFIDSTDSAKVDFQEPGKWIVPGEGYSNEGKKDMQEMNNYKYTTGWLPGAVYDEFPVGTAMKIHKNSGSLFLIHYAPSAVEEKDNTKLYI